MSWRSTAARCEPRRSRWAYSASRKPPTCAGSAELAHPFGTMSRAGGPERQRRALSHVGGPVEVHAGTAEQAAVLKHALEVGSDEGAVMAHVHGFHPYPARLHPATAAR